MRWASLPEPSPKRASDLSGRLLQEKRMRTNYGEKLAGMVSFLLMIEIFYFYETYITIGGFGVGLQYVGCFLVILTGGILFLIFPDLSGLYCNMKAAGTLMASYLMTMIFSAGIWIFSFTPLRQMISGFFEPAYMLLCIVCGAFLVYTGRERTLKYCFWAMTAALGLLVLPRIREFGIAEFFRRLMMYVASGGQKGMGISLEDTSFAYSYVFFALYFLFHRSGEAWWKRGLYLAVTVFALLVVLKRSSLLALAVGFGVAFVYSLLRGKHARLYVNFLVLGFMLAAFLYIPLIRSGLFERLVDALGINTSSRTRIYAYYQQYYEFSPSYLGRGLGWVWRLMSQAERFNAGLESVNVHCDYVRFYIELGFWGYLIWILSAFPLVVKSLVRGTNIREESVILGICAAMAMLCLTENVSHIYSAVLTMSVVIIQCVWNGKKEVLS